MLGMYCVPVHAQARASATHEVSVLLGGSVALGHSGISEQDVDPTSEGNSALDWGSASGSYGVQYLYHLQPRWALGLEYNGNNFDDATQTRGVILPPFAWWERDIDSHMDVHNVMAAGRFTFNPQSSFRFYVPFGAGVAFSKGTLKLSETSVLPSDYREEKFTGRNTSFAYYLGLGMEKQFAAHWAWGLEMRYQAFWFNNGEYNLPGVSGLQYHKYISGLLKVAYLF